MTEQLTLNLLGGCHVTLGGAALDLHFAKSRALLCYLAVTGVPHSRDALGDLLWGESSSTDARASLRTRLSKLRRALPGHLVVRRDSIAFNGDSVYELDVERFQVILRAADDPVAWRTAIQLYKGDFMDGVHIPRAPAFETWLTETRDGLRSQASRALEGLAAHHAGRGEYAQARDDLTFLLTLDPWREDAHRELMRVLTRNGQREAALVQYLNCRRVLQEELGIQPGDETTRLYEQIRSGEFIPVAPPPVHMDAEGERRPLTVMSCVLMGSDGVDDPEDLQEDVQSFHRLCTETVLPLGGVFAQRSGTFVMAYFGYPAAQEDDARRAVQAGLALLERAARSPPGYRLSVSIQTGTVVVTPGTAGLPEVVGPPLERVRRLHQTQDAGLWIGETTRQLVQGYFKTVPAALSSPGEAAVMEMHQVQGASHAQTRLQALPPHTALIGREDALAELLDWWHSVGPEGGPALLLRGEAGVGKSRLIHALRGQVEHERHHWLELQCAPALTQRPFAPVIALLERVLHLKTAPPGKQFGQLRDSIRRDGLPGENLPILAELLSIPSDDHVPVQVGGAERQRHLTFETLSHWFRVQAKNGKMLLVVEDLHWCDPSTLELIGQLLGQPATVRMLLTARPEFLPPWERGSAQHWLDLPPLTPESTLTLIDHLLDGRKEEPTLRRTLALKSDGLPLYVEELVRSILETPTDRERLLLPPTLQEALTARLDRLGAPKEVLQHAAVLGRTFARQALARVSSWPDAVLDQHLNHLVQSGLLVPEPDQRYRFHHALIQDAAYALLLKRSRQRLHARVAEYLTEPSNLGTETPPEELAQHYAAAGQLNRAADLWQTAATWALGRSAHQEAAELFRLALEALQPLDASHRRVEQQLILLTGLRAAHVMAEGYGSASTAQADAQVQALALASGATTQLFMTRLDTAGRHLLRAQYADADAILEQLGEYPRVDLNALHLGALHFMICRVAALRGQLQRSLAHAEQAQLQAELARLGGLSRLDLGAFDLWIAATGQKAVLLGLRGDPGQARRTVQHILQEAEQHGSPFTRTASLIYAMLVCDSLGEWEALEQHLDTFLLLATEQDMRHWRPHGLIWHAERQVRHGDLSGLSTAQAAFDQLDTLNIQMLRPYLLVILARTQRRAGQVEAACKSVRAALEQVMSTGEYLHQAELHRLHGEVLLDMDRPEEAEQALVQALTVAQDQGMKTLELRVTVSLARLWLLRRQFQEAYGVLRRGLAGWAGTFRTPDVEEATQLLTACAVSIPEADLLLPIEWSVDQLN